MTSSGPVRGERRRAPAPDLALEAGSSAHYEDPDYYTKTYRHRFEDVRFYTDLAEVNGGPVLEYGCGNGRITLPIARAGVEITGVDLSAPMLADLRRRLSSEPDDVRRRVRVVRGDMRRARLRRRFPLVVCPFNAFLHLYSRQDVERFLARAREHMTPRGELVLDVSIPEPLELSRDPARAYRTPRFLYPAPEQPGGAVLVSYAERFDYDKITQVLHVAMEFSPALGDPWMTPLAHRQFYPAELEALLHYNGFELLARHGDFEGAPLDRTSDTMILRCRARRSFSPKPPPR